uniref:Uncharacterized protein n=1 Tax=Anguilla anguilla TaxID=7936 RepID=A0A0E9W544_ANGAN
MSSISRNRLPIDCDDRHNVAPAFIQRHYTLHLLCFQSEIEHLDVLFDA